MVQDEAYHWYSEFIHVEDEAYHFYSGFIHVHLKDKTQVLYNGNVNELPLTKCRALTTTYQNVDSSILFIRQCDHPSWLGIHKNLHWLMDLLWRQTNLWEADMEK